jgi:predicted acetyltransferase
MTLDLEIGFPQDEREIALFAQVAARSLGLTLSPERLSAFVGRFGARNLRVVRLGDRIVGGLGLVPMGHWFAGRSVGSVGISAVAVSPEYRSHGIAAELMRTVLEEGRREGFALSSLFPAALPPYRAAGYEAAGTRFVYRVALSSLGTGAREPEMRAVASTADEEAMRAAYDARVRSLSGPTDRSRSSFFWPRVYDPAQKDGRAYLVEGKDGSVEGYVVVSESPTPEQLAARDLPLRDVVTTTPSAGRRLLRFLADHRSIWRSATFAGGPAEPLFLMARESRPEVTELWRWMLRILDVRAALEQRGWRSSVRGELHMDVRDPLLRENSRRWVLHVTNGRAHVGEGGSGALVLDVRGLAALYSGFTTAEELRAAGLCEGDDDVVATASALFAGPAPWTPDFF